MQRDPDKIAIFHGDKTRSYRDLVHRSEKLRDAALDIGLGRNRNAAVIARNCIEFMEVIAGVPDSGAAVATINPRMTAPELKAAVIDARPALIFVDEDVAPTLAAAGIDPAIRIVTFGEDYEAFLAAPRPVAALPQVDEWDIWTIPYTSGTTGDPKGVMLPHRSRMIAAMVFAAEYRCFGCDDRFLSMTPMNHGAGLGFPASALSMGGSVELLDKFDPLLVLDRLKNGGITGVFMVPTHFQMIFNLPPEQTDPYRSPPIRTIISNAAPLPQAMKHRIIDWFGDTILHEIYASTESGIVCNMRPRHQLLKERCVGTPMPHVMVEIRREDGSLTADDEVGELFSRSPANFNGYWNRPEETAATIVDGWISVGDMARRDSDGFLYIVDRKKDMVISGGVNIYPREIEELLFAHPSIADVAVVGVPDETWGEVLKTYAVPKDEQDLQVEDVTAYLTGLVSSYKIPRQLALIDALPRNANGKVLKTALRAPPYSNLTGDARHDR